jgi:hypothetical protein
MMLRRAAPLVPLLGMLAAGCAASADAPPNDGESEAEIRASCTNPKRYYVVSRNGPCGTIAGTSGSWVPEATPAFPDAPAEVKERTCVVRWTAGANVPPDKHALDAALGVTAPIAPACGPGASPEQGEVVGAPPPKPILGGSVGCDVCGIVIGGHIWVVLPPNVSTGRFTVPLSNGDARSFATQPNASPALSIQLPALPNGVRYQNGPVNVM